MVSSPIHINFKGVSDPNVTMVQSEDVNFIGRTTTVESNFFSIGFARIKNFPINLFVTVRLLQKGKIWRIKY